MDYAILKISTCCIIGRRNLIKGYEPTIEYELETLLVHGINRFLFCGLAPFEQACLRALHTLRTRHFFTVRFKIVLFSDDPAVIGKWRLSFDEVHRLYPPSNASCRELYRFIVGQAHYMVYFSKGHDYGGSYPAVRCGYDHGLRPINIAIRKKRNDNF
ncbi:hypothetical protein [Fumia xinanensis]|uniref:Uncharacterized protein n=1 Tax=Fumia xinanensis TaxID=2763659 RepID=A0A926I7T9_9FIRM|nr:hypothetical protein [Fumia xinanensis]MBC8560266.1 hypothetical protein [Fumia xinanensis]